MENIKAAKKKEKSFDEIYNDGKIYHRRSRQFLEEKLYSVAFNIGSVALEYYLIALCELNEITPMNHNYKSLIDDIESVMEVPQHLSQNIKKLDEVVGICSLEISYQGDPELIDAENVLSICNDVNTLFESTKEEKYKKVI